MSAEESKPAVPVKPTGSEARSEQALPPARRRRRWLFVFVVLVVVAAVIVGVPQLLHALNTVSTDDAYVNSDVTFVAPRVAGQVARVLVEDNNRVKKGDVLVELDAEPYQVQVAIKEAALDAAQ